jgi:hypothetical protein
LAMTDVAALRCRAFIEHADEVMAKPTGRGVAGWRGLSGQHVLMLAARGLKR